MSKMMMWMKNLRDKEGMRQMLMTVLMMLLWQM